MDGFKKVTMNLTVRDIENTGVIATDPRVAAQEHP